MCSALYLGFLPRLVLSEQLDCQQGLSSTVRDLADHQLHIRPPVVISERMISLDQSWGLLQSHLSAPQRDVRTVHQDISSRAVCL